MNEWSIDTGRAQLGQSIAGESTLRQPPENTFVDEESQVTAFGVTMPFVKTYGTFCWSHSPNYVKIDTINILSQSNFIEFLSFLQITLVRACYTTAQCLKSGIFHTK